MTDYLSINWKQKEFGFSDLNKGERFIDTVGAVHVKHGEWRKAYLDTQYFGERPSIFYCSACCACSIVKTEYCPNCGDDMRGKIDDQ